MEPMHEVEGNLLAEICNSYESPLFLLEEMVDILRERARNTQHNYNMLAEKDNYYLESIKTDLKMAARLGDLIDDWDDED